MADDPSMRDLLKSVFIESLETISGRAAVMKAIAASDDPAPNRIVAVGKAAVEMYEGCRHFFPGAPALVVTKLGHGSVTGDAAELIEAPHPMPDERSLHAGERLAAFIATSGQDDRLLVLVSGGASSLVEKLRDGIDLAALEKMTSERLADGSTIEELNALRIALSAIKGGKLMSSFPGKAIKVLAISDVSSDRIEIIGSGIGARGSYAGDYRLDIVASNTLLRSALEQRLGARGLQVRANAERLNGDVVEVADALFSLTQEHGPGAYVFGGEPTVQLPDKPGRGGRAQALALLLAQKIAGRADYCILVAGSDGSDGLSEATGAIVDGRSFARVPYAARYIAEANSGVFFQQSGEAIVTGPTGTNVADVAVLVRRPDR